MYSNKLFNNWIVCLLHYSTAFLATPDQWLKTVVSATYCLCAMICLDLIKRYHYLSHNGNTKKETIKNKNLTLKMQSISLVVCS